WERRSPDLPIRSPDQLVTLASIVEKETGRADERSRVAAVFVNRLKQKIKLQSDPTIIYGLVGGKGTLRRPIKRSEITQPSPYNTYVIDGLPPGPISNPRRASAGTRGNAGAPPRHLLRRGGYRRPRLPRNQGQPQEERRQAAGEGKGAADRYGRAGRGCPARRRGAGRRGTRRQTPRCQ